MAVKDAYRSDLAYIHDVGHGGFARDAAPGLLALLRRAGLRGGLVVDLGCGSGIWARALLDAGHPVLGIDLSPAMIALARRRAPEARFRVGSFLDGDLPPCRAVTSIGECVSYLFDGRNTERGLRRLFARIHRALAPGGLLLFDVVTSGRAPGPEPRLLHREGPDWAVRVHAREDRARRVLVRRITSFRKVGKRYRRDHEVHRQRMFEPVEVLALLRAAGFRARMVRGYGRQRFGAGHVGFVARKPVATRRRPQTAGASPRHAP